MLQRCPEPAPHTSLAVPYLHTFSVRMQLSCTTTESQNGRGWKGPLWVTQSNPPAQAGSPRAGCTAPRPGRAGISPEKETPQPPWAACSSAPSPSEGRSSSSCSDITSTAFDRLGARPRPETPAPAERGAAGVVQAAAEDVLSFPSRPEGITVIVSSGL